MNSFFDSAYNMKFSGSQSFTNANTIINNIFSHPAPPEPELGSSRLRNDDQWVTLPGRRGQRLRLIDRCDMNMLQETSSATFHVRLPTSKSKPTNPFTVRLETQRKSVKIRRKVYNAEIIRFGERKFTVVTYEPENEGDVEKIQMMLFPLCEIALSSYDVWLPQLYGFGRSVTPTLIYYDEIVDGQHMLERYWGVPIVYNHLWYNCYASQHALHDDGTLQKLSITQSYDLGVWKFNIRTYSWQYDVPSTFLPEVINNYASGLINIGDTRLSSPVQFSPFLDSQGIVRTLQSDYLHLIPHLSCVACTQHLTDYVCHGMLTFGVVVSPSKPGMSLWHFPSCPPPQCYYYNRSPYISVKYSESIPTLVDLTFVNKTDMRIDVTFELRLSPKQYQQLQIAYFIQSLPFYNSYLNADDTTSWKNLVFIDRIRFVLEGNLTSDLMESPPSKYLHVPPLFTQQVNGMPCIYWPPATPFFYWSSDPEGQNLIAEEDWDFHGIPSLTVQTWIGSSWYKISYDAVWDYFQFAGLSSVDFIKDQGYPILVSGDPHIRKENHLETGNCQVHVKEHQNAGDLHIVVEEFCKQHRAERSIQKKIVDSSSLKLLEVDASSVVGQGSVIEIPD